MPLTLQLEDLFLLKLVAYFEAAGLLELDEDGDAEDRAARPSRQRTRRARGSLNGI